MRKFFEFLLVLTLCVVVGVGAEAFVGSELLKDILFRGLGLIVALSFLRLVFMRSPKKEEGKCFVLKPHEELLIGILLLVLGLIGGVEVFEGFILVPERLPLSVFFATALPFVFFFSGNMIATGVKRIRNPSV